MVTAELAAALPVLVIVLAVAISAVNVSTGRIRAQDAAREAARAVARGDGPTGLRLARAAAPGAAVSITRTGDDVVVVVRVRQQLIASWLPSVTVSASAVAAVEPDRGDVSGVPP